MKSLLLSIVTLLFTCAAQLYAETEKPTIKKFSYSDNSVVESMSDNGEWGIAQPSSEDDQQSGHARLVNLLTYEEVLLQTDADISENGVCTASDVTDDGSIVVGSYKGYPAYWTKSTGTWTTLSDSLSGHLSAVTPDGKYAVGSINLNNSSWMQSRGIYYDMTTKTEITLTNLPTKDMAHEVLNQHRFMQISADGRYIVGRMSYSYVGQNCCYIYDTQNMTSTMVGFTPNDTAAWTPADAKLMFIDDCCMSPNGKWITGAAYTTSDSVDIDTGGYVTYKYNVETGEFALFNGSGDVGTVGYAICDDGTILGTTPVSTPLREWYVRRGSYWIAVSDIFTQRYDMDFYTTTQYERTGYPNAVSADGKTVIVVTDPTCDSYMVKFPESLADASNGINLLGAYTVSPTAGSSFAKMKEVEVTFTRDIAVINDYAYMNVALKDEDGSTVCNPLSNNGVSASGKVLTLKFRPSKAVMEAGKKYTLEIGAGTVTVDGDASVTNEKISIEYNGRDNVAVAPTNIYPADSTEVSFLDYSSNAVYVTFDTYLAKTDSASARLVNKKDGSTVCEMNLATSQNMLGVYPSAKQYLYNGAEYQVIINKGSVTDAQGYGGNDSIVINYTGVYEREISSDDATLFFDDISSVSQSLVNFMRYEGDHNTPTSDMEAWGFDTDNQPWNFSIRESSSSTDYCAGSHSMYNPAGKSDDWMVIPQLAIPDEFCTLSFLAQSYRLTKKDSLKVLVYTSDENINILTSDIIANMKSESDTVFNELLSPGATEEGLAGEWTKYTVDLAKYSGKNIYIAFLNDNEDQSAVFVDSVQVVRNLKYLLSLSNPSSVVNLNEIDIAGTLTANSDFDTFTSVSLALCTSDGTQVGDKVEQTGLSLKKGDTFPFAFTTPLPLTVSVENKFLIKVQLDDYADTKTAKIKDLSFEPVKRVVLEEFTGTTCPNCPRGIVAIENLRNVYGSQVIPVSIHTYDGDALGTGLSSYTSSLGLTSAPSGIVNRSGIISYPTWSPTTGAFLFNDYEDQNTWLDHVTEELNVPADAEVSLGDVTIDETANTFTVPVSVCYALTAKNLSLNVFVTVLEDSIITYQQNNCYAYSSSILGEWGKGGKYSASINYNIQHDDVCRAYYSSSIEGTSGYLPQSMTAGEPYSFDFTGEIPSGVDNKDYAKAVIMLLDANTGKVVNAAVAKFNPNTLGISDVKNRAEGVRMYAANGNIVVSTDGEANVSVYTIAGTQIASARTNGTATLSAGGYRGAAVVKVTTANGTVAKKLLVK